MQEISHIFTTEGLVSLFTLVVMEIVLGIDNIIFISIVSGKLPAAKQRKARSYGLMLALLMRVLLLFSISWMVGLKTPLFTVFDMDITGRSMILFAGGIFLMAKSVTEIHGKIEAEDEHDLLKTKKVSFMKILIQIILLDIVFSFDSILTAIGLVKEISIMIAAVVISMFIMLAFSGGISNFVNRHPGIKMLALAFLLMIGFLLVAESVPEPYTVHVPRAYLYFAMAFSFSVEMLNIWSRKSRKKKGGGELGMFN